MIFKLSKPNLCCVVRVAQYSRSSVTVSVLFTATFPKESERKTAGEATRVTGDSSKHWLANR